MMPKKVVAFGECMLEVQANGFGPAAFAYGGDTFNTAIYLRRCSHPQDLKVSYATGLGNDPLSEKLMKEWSREGLDLSCIRRVDGKLPGMYLIETDDQGERRFHFWRESSAARSYFDTQITPLEQQAADIDCLYFSGISLAILDTAARQRLFKLVSQLKNAGKHVVFDNNYRPRLWPSKEVTREVFEQAFSMSTLALITADDHQAVFGLNDLEQATQHAQSLNVGEIVIKRGSLPTLVKPQDSAAWVTIPTQRVQTVVDTTAAGDSFAAGYLSRRLKAGTAQEAADFGNQLAARVIQHRGAIIPAGDISDLIEKS
jgi:2-dehydro-3-deoxygluconokinase